MAFTCIHFLLQMDRQPMQSMVTALLLLLLLHQTGYIAACTTPSLFSLLFSSSVEITDSKSIFLSFAPYPFALISHSLSLYVLSVS